MVTFYAHFLKAAEQKGTSWGWSQLRQAEARWRQHSRWSRQQVGHSAGDRLEHPRRHLRHGPEEATRRRNEVTQSENIRVNDPCVWVSSRHYLDSINQGHYNHPSLSCFQSIPCFTNTVCSLLFKNIFTNHNKSSTVSNEPNHMLYNSFHDWT